MYAVVLEKKEAKLNIERWQFAVMNRLIGDDLMEDLFLEHYKWQANQPHVLLVPPWASLWSASQIFHVNVLVMLCDPKQPELHAYLL